MISAVIITYNEAKHIADAINSCKDIVDEVIVIDAESMDDTILLAEQTDEKVKTFVKCWNGYGAARNYGADQAMYDWIFSLDADERCSPDLRQAIKNLQLKNRLTYQVRRKNIYKSEIIKHGFLAPEWKARLYNKSLAKWDDKSVHETLQPINHKLEYRKIEGSLMHHAYKDQSDHREKLDRYAKLSVQSAKSSSMSFVWDRLAPMYHFCRAHFLKLGFLQTPYGIETSKNAFYYSKRKRYYLQQAKIDLKLI